MCAPNYICTSRATQRRKSESRPPSAAARRIPAVGRPSCASSNSSSGARCDRCAAVYAAISSSVVIFQSSPNPVITGITMGARSERPAVAGVPEARRETLRAAGRRSAIRRGSGSPHPPPVPGAGRRCRCARSSPYDEVCPQQHRLRDGHTNREREVFHRRCIHASVDDLIGAGQQQRRHGQTETFCCAHIDDQLESRWLLDR